MAALLLALGVLGEATATSQPATTQAAVPEPVAAAEVAPVPSQAPAKTTKAATIGKTTKQMVRASTSGLPAKDNAERGTRCIEESRSFMADIVGEESLTGQRMQAGVLLDMIDVLAGLCSHRHSGSRVATVAFNRVEFDHPILHGDLVRCEGQVVHVGSSSMLIEIGTYIFDRLLSEYVNVQRCFVTMVAITNDLRPNRGIPSLSFPSPEEEEEIRQRVAVERQRSAAFRAIQDAVAGMTLDGASIADDEAAACARKSFLAPSASEIHTRKVFLPRNLNSNDTIFGGDILLWMDRVASFTARSFTGNQHMTTISMNGVEFKRPVLSSQVVELVAKVCYVRTYILVVEMTATLQDLDLSVNMSHTGTFTVLNLDAAGFRRPIRVGLDLSAASQDELRSYEQAKRSYLYWRDIQSASETDQHQRLPHMPSFLDTLKSGALPCTCKDADTSTSATS